MRNLASGWMVTLCAAAAMLTAAHGSCQVLQRSGGEVEVRGKQLVRDGQRWIPHGFYQIAFEVAPANLQRADHPFWATASNNYTPEEYAGMRKAGADTVRIQIAQSGAGRPKEFA